MSHLEARLQADLDRIRERVRSISELVEQSTANALSTVLTGDEDLAYRTIIGDEAINRGVREIDRLCHEFVAVHLPSAGHLRRISATIRTILQLERIGDYAVIIARESVQMSARPDGVLARELETAAADAQRALHEAITAFNDGNGEAARATRRLVAGVERTMDGIYGHLLGAASAEQLKDRVAMFVVFNLLKRIWDQSKNICEETVFAEFGETKPPRVYEVLFVDRDNACAGPMAEAIATRKEAERAMFSSAGHAAADALDPRMTAFMADHGHDLSGVRPRGLPSEEAELEPYFLIVTLDGPVRSYVPRVPFHTSALAWDVGNVDPGATGEEATRQLEALYRELAIRIGDLLKILCGNGDG